MNSFIQANMRNNALTQNLAATNSTTLDSVVDLFFIIGASRFNDLNGLIDLFDEAFNVDPDRTLKILFYARDIEKGLGERKVFRELTLYLLRKHNDAANLFLKNYLNEKNIEANIIRVDDLVWLANEFVKAGENHNLVDSTISFLFKLLDNNKVKGIVAKWMPRKNSKYGALVRYMRKVGHINTYSSYRKQIVNLTNVVEQQMSEKAWNEINLEHVPSIAMKKYAKAFDRHQLLKPFIEKVEKGEAKINARQLFPYDIVHQIMKSHRMDDTARRLLDQQWLNLKELDELNVDFKAIPVIDVSGSMTFGSANLQPIDIAVGLGLFLAERNPNDAFKDYFITFSTHPAFQKISGRDITSKVGNAYNADWGGSTNLEAVFKLILNRAVKNEVPESDMPTTLIIFSDMEFNYCVKNPNLNAYEMIAEQYAEAGYKLPTVVFWNVNGRVGNFPAQKHDANTLLVSGASQNVINFVLKKGYENPMEVIDEIINSARYSHLNS